MIANFYRSYSNTGHYCRILVFPLLFEFDFLTNIQFNYFFYYFNYCILKYWKQHRLPLQ